MKTIAISEASAAQLAEFASSHLGMIGINASQGKERLIELIEAAGHEGDTIEIHDTERKPRAKAAPSSDPDRKVRIHIATGEGAIGARHVEVAVNGVLMLIPRGKDVEIPWKYLHVLQNAKASQAEVDDDGQIVGWREAPLYPVSVLGV